MTELRNLNKRLLELEDKYIEHRPINVFCGTYNVAGENPDESLASWLRINDKEIDVYAVGFQEVVDLTTTSLLLKTDWNEKETAWTDAVNEELLNPKNFKSKKYKLLSRLRMFGLYLLLYADEKLCEKKAITEIYTSYVATGMLTVGNKGSVGISLKIYQTRIVFVCSHFAAHTEQLQKRNSDFRSTRQYLKFQDPDQESSSSIDLDQHDIIFWFGDLNYRIDQVSLSETLKLINMSWFDELIKYDQLTNERNRYSVFESYNEGEIKFKPTYKYILKEDMYEKQAAALQNEAETGVNSKVKLPSWTDRVLWKTSNNKVELIQYSCVNTVTISDHKPVYAIFKAEVKKVNQKELNKAVQNLLKESDKKINEEMPHISIEKKEFRFENCMFYDTKTLFITVKNDGVSICNTEILYHDPLSKPLEDSHDDMTHLTNSLIRPRQVNQWVNIFPQYKERISPNSTFMIELSTAFNYDLLPKLNQNRIIEDFLIIKCLGGNHIFASLICIYKPTIIGVSLKALSTLKDSFEKCDQSQLITKVEGDINKIEKEIDSLFKSNLVYFTQQFQKENVERMLMLDSSEYNLNNLSQFKNQKIQPTLSNIYSGELNANRVTKLNSFKTVQTNDAVLNRIELVKKCLNHMNEKIKVEDEYFSNPLSDEYNFLLDHLIERSKENLKLESQEVEGSRLSSLTIEEQKNLILDYLSCRNYDEFERARFELDLLAEVLNDLLNALPQSLIPARYLDYCSYTANKYEEAAVILDYIPRSHSSLIQKIVQFLGINKKCLNTCNSNFDSVLADAIFQIKKADKSIKNTFGNAKNNENFKSQIADTFLKLFIDNIDKRE